jgi:predicted anti-sigma-YlaC factor YlaD
MTCEDAKRLLLDELAGRLDAGRRQQLHEHLAACTTCREMSDAQAEVSHVLASRPEAAVRADFAARLAGEIARQSGWFGLADWLWLSVRLAPIAALLLLAAGLVVERQAAQASDPASLSEVVETWATGDSGATPVTSVLWQPEASDDAALLTLLAAPSDATIVSQTNER